MLLTGGWVEPFGPELEAEAVVVVAGGGAAAVAVVATDPCTDTCELSWFSSFTGATVR